jgi:phage terminase large subunit-like protein
MSELWFTWNRRHPDDPVDKFLCGPDRPEGAIVVRANYYDNPFFPAELEIERQHDEKANPDRYGHIWLGEYEPVAVGAIWDRVILHQHRRSEPPEMARILVAIDPAVSSEPGSDEHGIIVGGLGSDGRGYVLEDGTLKGKPRDWAQRAITLLDKWDADAIVIERNQGGDMCAHTLRSVRPTVRIIEVTATRGKHVRAEPISALYHAGLISHVGTFERLENQLCQITAAGYEGEGSPDRADALVWLFTELFPRMVKKKPKERQKREPSYAGDGWMG